MFQVRGNLGIGAIPQTPDMGCLVFQSMFKLSSDENLQVFLFELRMRHKRL